MEPRKSKKRYRPAFIAAHPDLEPQMRDPRSPKKRRVQDEVMDFIMSKKNIVPPIPKGTKTIEKKKNRK